MKAVGFALIWTALVVAVMTCWLLPEYHELPGETTVAGGLP